MCKFDYKFRLDLEEEIINVYPIYEGKVLSSARTGKNKYLVDSINGKFYFVGDDFDSIMGEDIEWEFTLRIDRVGEDGVLESNWKIGTFTRLDGEVWDDKVERRFEVAIKLDDVWRRIEEKQEDDEEFFDLNVAARTVKYDIVPLFQIYNSLNGKISNHLKGNYWEEFAEFPTTDVATIEGFGFQAMSSINSNILRFGMGFGEPDINGNYNTINAGGFENDNGLYRIVFTLQVDHYTGELIRISDGEVLYEYMGEGLGLDFDSAKFIHVDGESEGLFNFQGVRLYSRVLVGVDSVAGQTVIPIPADDISTNKGNYSYIIEGSFMNVDVSTSIQLDVNEYPVSNIPTGSNDARYFVELASPPTWIPVLKSSWLGGAVFASYGVTGLGFFNTATKVIKNDYCYELVDVVRAMMSKQHGSDVTVGSTLGQFFGSTNPITKEAWSRIFITPKSNVKSVDFETQATSQKLRFSEIKNLLEFAFNCFPYREGSELRFEHNLFFENGKNYVTELVGTDLTTLFEAKTLREWAYATSKWSYAKEEIPSEIITEWSNETGVLFDGFRIKLLSKYVNLDSKDERKIGRFITDLDFTLSSPDLVDSDGFVMLFVDEEADGTLKVNYQDIDSNGMFGVQNGKGSLVYLHDKFHRNGLPCKRVEINGVEVDANSVKRTRVQELVFGDGDDIDNMQLISTNLGNGEIEKWDVNLDDNSVNVVIRHNIE